MSSAAPEPPALNDWIAANARTQRAADRDVIAVIRDAQRRINAELLTLTDREATRAASISELVRAEQLRQIKRALLRENAKIFSATGNITGKRRLQAAARAIQLSGQIDAVAFASAGREADARALTRGLTVGLERTLDVAVARMTGSRTELSTRVYRSRVLADGTVNRRINGALARGLNAREFAAEARDWINPNTPGGVRYASLRLARSEINNAFHAVAVQAAEDKPWVAKMIWHLSKSHPKPDICNQHADASPYEPSAVPKKPHPHCFCYVVPEVIEEDDFLDRLAAGDFDDYLESNGVEPSTSRPAPVTRVPSSPSEQLREHVASGVVSEEEFGSGGLTSRITLLRTRDGGRVIRKDSTYSNSSRDGEELTDAEVLAAAVMDVIGANHPAVARESKTSVLMELIEGERLGASGDEHRIKAERRELIEGRAGRLLGLADVLMGNEDRNAGNVIVRDGEPVGIDHGSAFMWSRMPEDYDPATDDPPINAPEMAPQTEDLFTDWLLETDEFGDQRFRSGALSAQELAGLRSGLEALRPQFESVDQVRWFDGMMTRLGTLERANLGAG